MLWSTAATISVAAIVHAIWPQPVLAGNTTCASNQMEWYSSVVGESPCVTYERLRQICNVNYQVPNFRPDTPGDQCDDQVSVCCCNTVAFQLSMLCMNCQYDKVDGTTIGIDAAVGTYTKYKHGCGAGTNNSLPQDIQSAVCNKDIRLDNFVYGGWSDGSWYYIWTKENAGRDHAAKNNNTFTHCPNQISPSIAPTSSSTSASSPDISPPIAPTITSTPENQTPSSSTSTSSSTSSSTSHASDTTFTVTSGSQISPSITETPPSTSHSLSDNTPMTLPETRTSDGPFQTGDNLNGSNSSSSSRSSTGAIVGGVVGGVGAVVLIAAAFLLWRMRKNRKNGTSEAQDSNYSYEYQSGTSPMGSATPFVARTSGSLGPAFQPVNVREVTSVERGGPVSVPWSQTQEPAIDPFGTTFLDEPRHEDGGTVVELVRSSSGRLPPAYQSWERTRRVDAASNESFNAGSNTGSVPDSVSGGGSEASSNAPAARYAESDPLMPLVPLRKE